MRYLFLLLFLTACAPTADIIVPTPCPHAVLPAPPEYPKLTRDATPKQVMEYFLETDMMKSKRIEQLETILSGYE